MSRLEPRDACGGILLLIAGGFATVGLSMDVIDHPSANLRSKIAATLLVGTFSSCAAAGIAVNVRLRLAAIALGEVTVAYAGLVKWS